MKIREVVFYILTLSAILTLLGCTSHAPERSELRADQKEDGVYTANLVEKAEELYGSKFEKNFDQCDFDNRALITEMLQALERNRTAIEDYRRRQVQAKVPEIGQTIRLGKFQFLQVNEPKSADDKWIEDSREWKDILEFYTEIKNDRVDDQWVNLNKWVRSMIMDEEKRLVGGVFMGIHANSQPMLKQISELLSECLMTTACVDPQFTAEQKEFISEGRRYGASWEELSSRANEDRKRRAALQKLKDLFESDLSRFQMVRNPTARVEGKTLVVPLDVTVFGDDAKKVIRILEETWNTDPDYKLRIEEIKKPTAGYEVNVSLEYGERAFVNREQQLLQLYEFDKITALAHEFGHVIGFRDEYYTTWNPKTCSYTDEANPANIMSISATGSVLPAHWTEIKKMYWKD